MNNPRKSLATRIWLIVLLAVILSTGSFCSVSLIQANHAISKSTRQRMLDIGKCASGSVDGDTLKRLGEDSELNPGYRRVYNALAVYRDNVDVDSVYTILKQDDGQFIITIDTALDGPAKYGDPLVVTDALIKASKGIDAVDDKPYTDSWGTFYSAYSPVFDSDGKIVGIVGVDFTKEWYEGQQREQIINTMILFFAAIFITLAVVGTLCFLQIRAITKPVKQITAVAERYQNGDYDGKLEIDREDELGIMARAFQSMATALTERIKEADDANRAKSSFLANMSHEIRTPINAVLGMNEMILRESTDSDIRAYSENVKTSGATLLSIINDILDFSKIEAGKLEIIPVDYDLSSVINDLVNLIRSRVDEKGLELILDFNPDIPKNLKGDAVRIKQIITNLLTNAVKYTEKGSITFSIDFKECEMEPDSVFLEVSVKDTGIGMKDEDVDKLFSKFERIEEKRNRNIEGTGLGMSITENLLEMMGSELQVESVYGKGSTFRFSLKQKTTGSEVLGDYETSYKEFLSKSDRYKAKFKAPEAHILVVDDNEMNLVVFKNLIKETQVVVDIAGNGFTALERMREKKYDIIFLDHMMPEKDGIMTLQEMKQEKDNPNLDTPTVCLTANVISGAREEYIAVGFTDYLTKPIHPESLEAMLLKYLPDDLIMTADDTEDKTAASGNSLRVSEKLAPLADQDLIDIKIGIENSGSERIYMEVLTLYSRLVDAETGELNRLYLEEDFENYIIKIDAIKNACRTIGAIKTADEALKLVNAGKNKDYDYIRENHDRFIEGCQEVRKMVGEVIS